jgi:hypothetical protein
MRATVDIPASAIERIGRAAFGEQWQSPLSRSLGVDDRTVRRWAQSAREGESLRVRHGLLTDLRALMEERSVELADASRLLTELLAEA